MRVKKGISLLLAACAAVAVTVQAAPGVAIDAATADTAAVPNAVPLLVHQNAPADVPDTTEDSTFAGATLLGNGHMGAAIFGDVSEETVLLNEKTIWSGDPDASPLRAASTNKLQLNLLRQRLQDEAGQTISPDAQDALTKYLTGETSSFGAYEELDLLRISDTPLDDLAYGIKDITTNSGTPYVGAEGPDRAFDNDPTTKWCYLFKDPSGGEPVWIEWHYGAAITVDSYRLTTANDVVARDPRSWTLFGSNTGEEGSFVPIDVQTDVTLPDARRTETIFTLKQPATYQYYRLELYAIKGQDGMFQMSEFFLLGDFNRTTDTPPADTSFDDYSRVLDLETGVATTSYTRGGVRYTREYFMSYPDRAFVMRITADKAGALSSYIGLDSRRRNSAVTVGKNTLTLTAQPDDQKADGLHIAQQLQVIAEGGSVEAGVLSLHVKNANALTLIVTADTNYDPAAATFSDPNGLSAAVIAQAQAAADKGYAALRDAHVEDHRAAFGGVTLLLGGAEDTGKTPDELLAGYGVFNTAGEDRYLETLYYQYARYLLLASAREDSLPAGGIWSWGLSNGGGYSTSATASAALLAATTGLPDDAFAAYIRQLADNGRQTAAQYHVSPSGSEVRGWTAYTHSNLWGSTAPSGDADGFYFPAASALLVQALWDQYTYSGNKAALADSYRAMADAALFWVDNLWTDQRDGTLVANPSYSPADHSVSLGSARDQALLEQLFETVAQAAQVLGKDGDAEIAEIRAAQAKLKQTAGTPDDIAASNGERLLLWAQAGDSDRAFEWLQTAVRASEQLATDGNGRVDDNWTAAAGMTALLLQSDADGIALLPALPDAWANGRVSGLRAAGGLEIGMTWADGRLLAIDVASPTAQTCTLRGEGLANAALVDSQGKAVAFTAADADTITFEAAAGETYAVQAAGGAPGDVNFDGSVDSSDARLVLQAAVNKITLSTAQQQAANVSGDDSVDSTDARLILQFAVNKITEFPSEKG